MDVLLLYVCVCVCKMSTYCVCVCVCMHLCEGNIWSTSVCVPGLLAEGRLVWAFAMLSQQGAGATSVGTDGLNSLSPWFTIQTDRNRERETEREREREREREGGTKRHHYRVRFNHWNEEKRNLKIGTLQLQSWEDTNKLEVPRDKYCASNI